MFFFSNIYLIIYFEVDFHRSPSCKPLPDDLLTRLNGQISKFSVRFFS